MTSQTPEASREPIAIVGIGCHLPGGASSPAKFWDLLASGTDATREAPPDRWDMAKFYDPDANKLGKMTTHRGGFLDRVDEFDASFFGIAPREAIWLDPQQRLLLRAAWEALEDAGQDVAALAGTATGVYMGGFTLDYQLLQNYGIQSRYEMQAHSATGMMMTMLANRLSYSFDFRGPSMAVDTACSGSLVAVHLAAQAIWNGECSLALAGGVNVMLAPNMTIAESKGGFLSPDGRCKSFSAAANGYARGEGAGVVVLKPLSQAQKDGDSVYAAVLGTAVTQDGHTSGITVPNGHAQEAAMRAAYARAGVKPAQVHYVEAHGTGTPVGDPIEAAAIGHVLSEGRAEDDPVVVGSVKTNLGHLEAAAGVTGLIKTAMMLKRGEIPKNLHFDVPNPNIPFDELHMRVPTSMQAWPANDEFRYAGVNSFGFGGTNAHVVLRDVTDSTFPSPRQGDSRPRLLPLSARDPEALKDLASSMATFLTGDASRFDDVVHSCSRRRTHHEYRLALSVSTHLQAAEQLSTFAEGHTTPGAATGRAPASERPKLAFVCSGMGPQWWGMARELLESEPIFRNAVERCDAELAKYTGWSLTEAMLADEAHSRMAETEVAQPANFAVQVGLGELWRSWGIVPDAIVGHSTGEVAAHYLAGVLSFEDAVKVNYYRSNLQQRTTGTGRMLAVGLSPETLNQVVAGAGPLVSVAAINGPSAVTLAGDETVLAGMASQLETFGIFHRFLQVKVPYHSHYMDPLHDDLIAGLQDLNPSPGQIPLYSTVTGTVLDGPTADASYWWRNVRATVLFQAAFSQMVADGYTQFVELGPHPVLASSMRQLMSSAGTEGLLVPSMRRGTDEAEQLRQSLGLLHCHGQQVDWDNVNGPAAVYIKLPTYPWQVRSYWNESVEAAEDRHYVETHPLLGQRMNAPHATWEHELNPGPSGYLADHKVQGTTLMPAAGFIEMAFAAARQTYGETDLCLQELDLRRALVLSPTADPRVRTTLIRETGAVEFASFTALPSGERQWAVHATTRIHSHCAAKQRLDLQNVASSVGPVIGHTEFYEFTRSLGFEYGPSFQAVQSVRVGDGVAVAAIRVPDPITGQLDAYTFHPSLLDAAFQVLITAALTQRNDGHTDPYLPVGVDRITILAPAVENMVVVARVVSSDAQLLVSDVSVCAPDGQCLVQIEGFRAQSLESAVSLTPERIDAGLLALEWDEVAAGAEPDPATEDAPPAGPMTDSTWLIFADAGGAAARLAVEAGRAGHAVALVTHQPVEEMLAVADGAYVVDRADPGHYISLLESLKWANITRVIHAWSLDIRFDPQASATQLEGEQELGVLSVMYLMQALAAARGQVPQVWLITRGAVSLPTETNSPNVAAAPLWGLGRVIGHQEFTSMWGGLVDFDPTEDPDETRLLLHDIEKSAGEDQLAYRQGRRFAARLRPCRALSTPVPGGLRPDRSYLVTGGLGALGLIVAKVLSDRGARHIVLAGRTRLPPSQAWGDLPDDHSNRAAISAMQRLQDSGTAVEYVAVDVTDEGALTAWLRERGAVGHPELAGVVHAAGAVDDQLLVKMDGERFSRVLRPKLMGAWNLHRALEASPLDFFIMFSSTGSVITSPGQANYASGNAFLDALSHHRRAAGLPATSIGWGPWSVGMVEDLDLEQMYTRKGIDLITPAAGSQILGRLIGQKVPHVLAITADWAKVRESSVGGLLPAMYRDLGTVGDNADRAGAAAAADALLARLAALPETDRGRELAKHLRDVTALVMGIDSDALGLDEALSGLGMDSMMAIEVKHRVEAGLHVEVSVLDLLQGGTIGTLSTRLLSQLPMTPPAQESTGAGADRADIDLDKELDKLIADLSPEDLDRLVAQLEDDEAAATPIQVDRRPPAPEMAPADDPRHPPRS